MYNELDFVFMHPVLAFKIYNICICIKWFHLIFKSHLPIISTCLLSFRLSWRYQPEQLSTAYEMANTQDEPESYSEGNSDVFPQPEDTVSIKNLLSPSNPEPSPLSGRTVNICTSILGEPRTRMKVNNSCWSGPERDEVSLLFSPPVVLMCVFSVVASQQTSPPWAVVLMSVTMAAIVLLTFVIFRQPQSKAKLAFKVSLTFKPFANFLFL